MLHIGRARSHSVILVLLALALILSVSFPVALAEAHGPDGYVWTENAGNPVFSGTSRAYYPRVIKVDGIYHMWYTDTVGGLYRVGHTTSADGTTWNSPTLVTGLTGQPTHVVVVNVGSESSPQYKIWYADGTTWPYNDSCFRTAESSNGLDWTSDQAIGQNPSARLVQVPGSQWVYGSYGPGAVLYNPSGYGTLNMSDPMGNKYVMYYDQYTYPGSPTTEVTMLAVSVDGVNWSRWDNNPLPPVINASGGSTAWDAQYVYVWSVIKDSGGYHAWYSGGILTSDAGIGYAHSTDGLNWTKDTNSLLHKNDPGVPSWRASRTYTPCVLQEGDTYKMWYSGLGGGVYGIGLATALAAPTISTVIPNSGVQGQTISSAIITGRSFTGATSLSFGSGITVTSFHVDNSTQITANITIDSLAATGSRNVSVTAPSGIGTLTDGFTVNAYVTPSHFGTGWYEQFTGYRPSPSLAYVYGQNRLCQTFVPSKDHYFNSVSLWLYKSSRPSYTVTIALHSVDGNHRPVEPALCSTSFAASSAPMSAAWRTYGFSPGYQLSAGTEYALVISANGGPITQRINVRTYATDVYSGGQLGVSSDAGATWLMNPGADVAFKEGQDTWHEAQTSTTPGIVVLGQYQACQTFTPSRDHYLNYVSLFLYKIGSPTYTVTISLHNVDGNHQPVQPALCSTSFAASSLTKTATWRTCGFAAGYQVSAGTQYALVISGNGSNGYVVAGANSAGGYNGGECGLSTDGGANWQTLSGPDLAFREGESPWNAAFGSSNAWAWLYGQNQLCQTFTPSSDHYFNYVSLSLYRIGSPMYNVTISLYNVDGNHQPTGSPLCSTTFAASSLALPRPSSNTYPWYEFRFPTGCQLSQGIEYALALSGDSGDAANCVAVRIYNKNYYYAGQRGQSVDGGASWQMIPTQDMTFMEGGSQAATLPGSGWYEQFTGYLPSPSVALVYDQSQVCQTFTPSKDHYFNSVSLWLSRVGTLNYTVTISLHAVDGNHQPTGSPLCTTSFPAYSLPTTATTWRTYGFATGCQVSAGTEYALVISANGGLLTQRINVRTYAADAYNRGQMGTSANAGATWQMNPDADMAFKEGQDIWYESQTATTPGMAILGQNQVYQTFTPSRDHYFNYVSLYLSKIGLPTYNVTVSLHNVDGNHQPTGSPLCSTTFAASSLSNRTAAWRTYAFAAGYQVSAGTEYSLVISASGSNGYVVAGANTTDGYNGGGCGLSTDGGASWQALPGPDLAFMEGESPWNAAFSSSNASAWLYGQNQLCQTFTPSKSHYFDYVSLSLYRFGNPLYNVNISLYNVDSNHQPTGSPLCSTTFAASALTVPPPSSKTYPWYEFRFPTGCELSQGMEYALVLSSDGGDALNCVTIRIYTKNYYPGGQRGQSLDGGASWQMLPLQDMTFIEGGVSRS